MEKTQSFWPDHRGLKAGPDML